MISKRKTKHLTNSRLRPRKENSNCWRKGTNFRENWKGARRKFISCSKFLKNTKNSLKLKFRNQSRTKALNANSRTKKWKRFCKKWKNKTFYFPKKSYTFNKPLNNQTRTKRRQIFWSKNCSNNLKQTSATVRLGTSWVLKKNLMMTQSFLIIKNRIGWDFLIPHFKSRRTLPIVEEGSKTETFLLLMVQMQPTKTSHYLNGLSLTNPLRWDLIIKFCQNHNSKCGLNFYGTGLGNFWDWVLKYELNDIIETSRYWTFTLKAWYLSNWNYFQL